MKKSKYSDMTNDPIAFSLISFALPLFAGSIFQLLYNTADLLFVGNLVGKTAAAAVGASSTLVTCLIGLFTGISVGAGVAVAQAYGAGDFEKVDKVMHTAAAFSVIAGILMTILGEAAARSILQLLQTPEHVIPDAVDYIRLYFLGMLPMIIYNVGAGLLRACGDSSTPFRILAAGGFLNVLTDALMIGVFHMEVRGAAIATTVSQTFSAVAVCIVLMKGKSVLKLRVSQIRVWKGYLGRILQLGLPAGIQSMTITLSNIVVQYYINGFGEDAVAAFSTYFRLENFAYLPVLAFGQAATTFVGQNYGAGKMHRVKQGMVISGAISMGCVAAIAFGLLAIGSTAVGWFVKDEAVIAIGLQIISISFPFYWLNSLVEVLGGTLRGMGRSMTSMIMVLLSLCGLRIVLLWYADLRWHTIQSLASVYPITWGTAVALLLTAVLFLFYREKR
ncbi:MAG: MATE family efflux transporter [Lachnospiraceae bacterium]|nr:MATE family efflux transporter [Lachnospiraceae bacterium]